MKRIFRVILELLAVSAVITIFLKLTAFAGFLPISEDPFREAGITAPAKNKTGQEIARDLVFNGLNYVKTIVVVVGIIYVSLMGYTLLTGGGEEEKVTKAKRSMTYMIVAFVLISMSQDIARLFDMDKSTILDSPQEILRRVHIFDKQVEIFITFVKYTVGAYATLMIVRSGAKMVTAGGDEEAQSMAKRSIFYSSGGLLLLVISDIFINRVFYKVDREVYSGITGVHPSIDAKAGVEQITGITNLIVSFIGPLALLMLIVGAFMYATAAGEEEKLNKAKRLILATVVGIVIVYGAFAVVSTIISGQLANIGVIQ